VIGVIREEFKRAIDKAIAEKAAFISAGKAESFERYKELVGEIRGLKAAADLLKDVIKRHGEISDDE
jgi:hypothetical protein